VRYISRQNSPFDFIRYRKSADNNRLFNRFCIVKLKHIVAK